MNFCSFCSKDDYETHNHLFSLIHHSPGTCSALSPSSPPSHRWSVFLKLVHDLGKVKILLLLCQLLVQWEDLITSFKCLTVYSWACLPGSESTVLHSCNVRIGEEFAGSSKWDPQNPAGWWATSQCWAFDLVFVFVFSLTWEILITFH